MNKTLKVKGRYSTSIRSFALTLHFYSAKAYKYVRKYWSNLLPHPATIREWYKVVNGYPGFTKVACHAIKMRASVKDIVINLVIDDMSIKENLTYDKNEFYGGVHGGTLNFQQENDNIIMATNALVIMTVALNEN